MEDSGYVCTLDDKALTKAKEELFEDPKERLSAVKTLREWIKSQKYLDAPTDTITLLAFLRGNKFSQLLAREMIERYLTSKTKMPDWLDDIDPRNPDTVRVFDEGILCKLPNRDKQGRVILLRKPAGTAGSTSKRKDVTFTDLVHADVATMSTFLFDEVTMVNGMICMIDMSGMTMKQFTKDMDGIKRWSQCWEGHFPGRFKEFHFYNTGAIFEAVNAIIRPFMSKKMQDRMRIHPTMESVYKSIPMECLPDEYLPDDYTGPRVGTIQECLKKFKNEVLSDSNRQIMLEFTNKKYKIDLSQKPGNSVPQASFRKLNVD